MQTLAQTAPPWCARRSSLGHHWVVTDCCATAREEDDTFATCLPAGRYRLRGTCVILVRCKPAVKMALALRGGGQCPLAGAGRRAAGADLPPHRHRVPLGHLLPSGEPPNTKVGLQVSPDTATHTLTYLKLPSGMQTSPRPLYPPPPPPLPPSGAQAEGGHHHAGARQWAPHPRHWRRCQRRGDDPGGPRGGGYQRAGGAAGGDELRLCHRTVPLPGAPAARPWALELQAHRPHGATQGPSQSSHLTHAVVVTSHLHESQSQGGALGCTRAALRR
eukprot:1194959-Prorocentrum_minimum.AAC.5